MYTYRDINELHKPYEVFKNLYTWNAFAGEGGHLHLVESVGVPLDHAVGVEQGHGDSRILEVSYNLYRCEYNFIYMNSSMFSNVYTSMYTSMCIFTYVYIQMYIHKYIYIYICIYINKYIYICIYTIYIHIYV
jgi:hypothetical protein